MGKGDKKTKRGKIILGSHGVTRPRKTNSNAVKEKASTETGKATKPTAKAKPARKSKEE